MSKIIIDYKILYDVVSIANTKCLNITYKNDSDWFFWSIKCFDTDTISIRDSFDIYMEHTLLQVNTIEHKIYILDNSNIYVKLVYPVSDITININKN